MAFGPWGNYVPTTKQPAIRAFVEVTGTDVDQLNGISKQIRLQSEALLKKRAAILHQRIVDTWPIAARRSRLSIARWSVTVSGLEVKIDNPAPYVIYVHRPGARGGLKRGWKTIWNTEINSPNGMIRRWFGELTTDLRKLLIASLAPKQPTSAVRGGRFRLR